MGYTRSDIGEHEILINYGDGNVGVSYNGNDDVNDIVDGLALTLSMICHDKKLDSAEAIQRFMDMFDQGIEDKDGMVKQDTYRLFDLGRL